MRSYVEFYGFMATPNTLSEGDPILSFVNQPTFTHFLNKEATGHCQSAVEYFYTFQASPSLTIPIATQSLLAIAIYTNVNELYELAKLLCKNGLSGLIDGLRQSHVSIRCYEIFQIGLTVWNDVVT